MTAKDLNQQQIGVTDFFSEGVVVSAPQRIEVRKVASAMGIPAKSGEEAEAAVAILERLQIEAQAAGGEAPLPAQPDTTIVRELRDLAGNRQIVEVAEKADTLIDCHRDWSSSGEAAKERFPEWLRLERLLHHARTLPVATELNSQMDAIRSQRSLLTNPNPISPLLSKVNGTPSEKRFLKRTNAYGMSATGRLLNWRSRTDG